MTEKVFPFAMTLINFVISNDELNKFESCLPSTDDKLNDHIVQQINLTIGLYLAATLLYEKACTPGRIKGKLVKLKKLFGSSMQILDDILPEDEFGGMIVTSINRCLTRIPDVSIETELLADDVEASARESECLRNLIDYHANKLHNKLNTLYIFDVVQSAHKAIEDCLQAISSNGGATGDPYVHEFYIAINECYKAAGGDSTYSAEALEFVDIARQIAVEHLGKCGCQNAAKRLKQVNREGLKDSIRDAFEARNQKSG